MSKKDTRKQIFTSQMAIMAVFFIAVGFMLGIYVEVDKLLVSDNSMVIEERSYIGESVDLPNPKLDSKMSVEEAMQERRSKRAYTDEALTMDEVSQLLWALQGQTADWGGRTVPSAKGAYPLHVTVVAKNVEGLEKGVYHFDPATHSLMRVIEEVPASFDEAAVQGQNKKAPVSFILSGDYLAMSEAFDGESHDQNVVLEVGHAGQNAYLQVESLGLGTVVSGGFNKALMKEILQIPAQEDLFYLIPVGNPAKEEAATH